MKCGASNNIDNERQAPLVGAVSAEEARVGWASRNLTTVQVLLGYISKHLNVFDSRAGSSCPLAECVVEFLSPLQRFLIATCEDELTPYESYLRWIQTRRDPATIAAFAQRILKAGGNTCPEFGTFGAGVRGVPSRYQLTDFFKPDRYFFRLLVGMWGLCTDEPFLESFTQVQRWLENGSKVVRTETSALLRDTQAHMTKDLKHLWFCIQHAHALRSVGDPPALPRATRADGKMNFRVPRAEYEEEKNVLEALVAAASAPASTTYEARLFVDLCGGDTGRVVSRLVVSEPLEAFLLWFFDSLEEWTPAAIGEMRVYRFYLDLSRRCEAIEKGCASELDVRSLLAAVDHIQASGTPTHIRQMEAYADHLLRPSPVRQQIPVLWSFVASRTRNYLEALAWVAVLAGLQLPCSATREGSWHMPAVCVLDDKTGSAKDFIRAILRARPGRQVGVIKTPRMLPHPAPLSVPVPVPHTLAPPNYSTYSILWLPSGVSQPVDKKLRRQVENFSRHRTIRIFPRGRAPEKISVADAHMLVHVPAQNWEEVWREAPPTPLVVLDMSGPSFLPQGGARSMTRAGRTRSPSRALSDSRETHADVGAWTGDKGAHARACSASLFLALLAEKLDSGAFGEGKPSVLRYLIGLMTWTHDED